LSVYHVYNRGNHRELIFRDNEDRKFFLSKTDEFCDRDRQTVTAYCLMDNHFHFLLRQNGALPISRTMHSLLTSYVMRCNKKYGLIGRLFQGPYQASWKRTDEAVAYSSRYIHRNPEKFADIRTYRWSSYRQYLGGGVGIADPSPVLEMFASKDSYATFTESSPRPGLIKRDGKFFPIPTSQASVLANALQ
jgi:REP element-mobilizing transposase RayT